MSQSEIYTVFCIVVDIGRAFPVDIEKNETIGWLKGLITERDPKTFADVQSYLLDLYHVDIADDKDMMANVKAYPLDSQAPVVTTTRGGKRLTFFSALHLTLPAN